MYNSKSLFESVSITLLGPMADGVRVVLSF